MSSTPKHIEICALLCRWAKQPAKVAASLTRLAVLPRTSRAKTLLVSWVCPSWVVDSPVAVHLPMYASLATGASQACIALALAQAHLNLPLLAGDLSGGLPGSNVTKSDLPDGPKPGQALKNLPSGSAGSQVSSQVCWHARLLAAVAQMLPLSACSGLAALLLYD